MLVDLVMLLSEGSDDPPWRQLYHGSKGIERRRWLAYTTLELDFQEDSMLSPLQKGGCKRD
jgi:hypothetical protein